MSNIKSATAVRSRVLAAQKITGTSAVAVVACPRGQAWAIESATVCNTSAAAVTLTVEVVPRDSARDGSGTVLSGYSINAGDTASLRDVLVGVRLGPYDAIWFTPSASAALAVVVTGEVTI